MVGCKKWPLFAGKRPIFGTQIKSRSAGTYQGYYWVVKRYVCLRPKADISRDGNLTIIGNDLLANGVVDADRDSGPAVITMASSATLDAGSGEISIDLRAGTGKTNLDSSDVTLGLVTTTSTSSTAITLTLDSIK